MNTTSHSREIDQFDHRIIEALLSDGRMSVTDLAKRVGLSNTPCQVRLRRLIEDGYILGFRAIVDVNKLGKNHVAFTEVKLSDTRENALNAFNVAVRKLQEVEECHMIAGAFDYLLKIRTSDIANYRQVLGEKISSLPFVANTSTFVAMEAIKENGL
ncbi:winged helix-turn-helix transcriptional regulator (plasmid) [Rhizobium grahamii]|uniref:Winged helix-turn-helix transcriptional regulator n=1 Tax=Rhizobium grahamii TaxID=1120045 RepID=A0A5Q0CB36_9HYPH|nr:MULTISPECIES: Lrp/AsnC ligand binding domain-containing protein [Rhizobium]QFY62662.1 winged helix-turn-helix transcriptional regulator [Rhizobium grahamii]QRM52596.1 winged helix-turn-helix transcriptional regulator [Rhizobium sp. BG6]